MPDSDGQLAENALIWQVIVIEPRVIVIRADLGGGPFPISDDARGGIS